MPILERIRRLASANISHWLNQIETPEDEVEAKIRELENGAIQAKNALANFAVTYKRLEKNIEDLRSSVAGHQHRAEQALLAGDEPSARRALNEKLKVSERIESLLPVLDSRRETYDELKESLVEIHDQLNQARARLMDLRARKRAAEAEQALGHQLDSSRLPPEVPFERLEDAVVEAEVRSDVDREIRGEMNPKPIEHSLREQKVDDALKSLQQKLAVPTSGE